VIRTAVTDVRIWCVRPCGEVVSARSCTAAALLEGVFLYMLMPGLLVTPALSAAA
jgi:hypothetical protein